MGRRRALFTASIVSAFIAIALKPLQVPAQVDFPSAGISSSRYPQQTGEAIYQAICQACHMPDGKGAIGAGTYPSLASNPRLAAMAYAIVIVLNGQKAMPHFGEDLSDEQVATVVNYVRSHFSNTYNDIATASDVTALRQAVNHQSR